MKYRIKIEYETKDEDELKELRDRFVEGATLEIKKIFGEEEFSKMDVFLKDHPDTPFTLREVIIGSGLNIDLNTLNLRSLSRGYKDRPNIKEVSWGPKRMQWSRGDKDG